MIAEKFSLTGKVAVVTGASRGIGQALALGLAEAGADVVVSSRNLEPCQAVARQIEGMGRRALAVAADVSHEADVERLFASTLETFGKVDILVNNAGIGIFKPTLKMTLEEWNQVLATNLTGAWLCARAAGRSMLKQGGGSIINISSTTCHASGPFLAPYAASKAGLEGLTRQLAMEWAYKKVRVNCIVYGIVETDMLAGVVAEEAARQRLFDRTPFRRPATPEETVGIVLLMASEASSYMTGSVVFVDGGVSAG